MEEYEENVRVLWGFIIRSGEWFFEVLQKKSNEQIVKYVIEAAVFAYELDSDSDKFYNNFFFNWDSLHARLHE